MDDKSEAKTRNPARIVMLVLLGVILITGTLVLALNVMTYVQMKNAMNWSPDTDITQEDKDRYASLVMIHDINSYIDTVNIRIISTLKSKACMNHYPLLHSRCMCLLQ